MLAPHPGLLSGRALDQVDHGLGVASALRGRDAAQVVANRRLHARARYLRLHGWIQPEPGRDLLTTMELGGLEPPTSWVRSRRSPN